MYSGCIDHRLNKSATCLRSETTASERFWLTIPASIFQLQEVNMLPSLGRTVNYQDFRCLAAKITHTNAGLIITIQKLWCSILLNVLGIYFLNQHTTFIWDVSTIINSTKVRKKSTMISQSNTVVSLRPGKYHLRAGTHNMQSPERFYLVHVRVIGSRAPGRPPKILLKLINYNKS